MSIHIDVAAPVWINHTATTFKSWVNFRTEPTQL